MKKLIAFTSAAVATAAAFAAPVVQDVVMTQDASKTVNITYKLKNEPGIVTVDIQTNTLANGSGEWVSIGGQHLTYFAGDVNRLVQPSDACKITWKPRKAWPDNAVTENVKAVVSAWAVTAPPDYMVVSLTAGNEIRYYVSKEAVPFGVTNDMYKTEYLVMRKIPAANVEWRMGSPSTENGRSGTAAREKPHLVTLTNDYYIGVYEVTQRQYQLIMGEDARPSNFKLDADYATRPLENITYEDLRGTMANGFDWPNNGHAVKTTGFIGQLRKLSGADGFDLPTDAQWEFACRAGCGAALYNGKELDGTITATNLNSLARYGKNGGLVNGSTEPARTCTVENGTAKVGSFDPNAWGLYDMIGNVYEWCLDWYADEPFGSNIDTATGPSSGTLRLKRSSGYNCAANLCRSAVRGRAFPEEKGSSNGFRLACSVDLR